MVQCMNIWIKEQYFLLNKYTITYTYIYIFIFALFLTGCHSAHPRWSFPSSLRNTMALNRDSTTMYFAYNYRYGLQSSPGGHTLRANAAVVSPFFPTAFVVYCPTSRDVHLTISNLNFFLPSIMNW